MRPTGLPVCGRTLLGLNGAIDADGLVVELGRRRHRPLPASSATGEFQEVTQVVPVRVAILDRHELPFVPGMITTVRIYRH